MDARHEARLLADAATLGAAQALGVPTTALSGDIRGVLSRDHAVAGVVAKGGGFKNIARAMAKLANENAESWLRAIIETGRAATRFWRRGWPRLSAFPQPNTWARKVLAVA